MPALFHNTRGISNSPFEDDWATENFTLSYCTNNNGSTSMTRTIENDVIHSGDFVLYAGHLYICCAESADEVFILNVNGNAWKFKTNVKKVSLSEEKVRKFAVTMLDWCNLRNRNVAVVKALWDTMQKHYPDVYNSIEFPVCEYCGAKLYTWYNVNGKVVCADCRDRYFVRCGKCGEYGEKKDFEQTREGEWLCEGCKKRNFVLPYHRLYPKVKFYGNNHENSVPYLGFELEVDEGGECAANVGNVMPLINKPDDCFAYCSHDSSINDGFEIISQPATMEYHNSIKDVYTKTISALKKMGYASHDTVSCGLHVHFNRSFFGENEKICIRRFIFMTEKFWEDLVIFARRPERRMKRYAKKIEPMEITQYIDHANKSRDHDYHYYSVNIANQDTIEFRIFRGTLNVNTLLATLQLVNNMAIIAKEKHIKEISKMKFEDLLTTKGQKAYWERHKVIRDCEE